jgi:hypothetical protein
MSTISGVKEEVCECCNRLKPCRLYTLQNGEAAWVCKKCRKGKKS